MGNYRPISLLPILGKVFEKIVARKFKPHIFKLLHRRQHGFRKGTSTEGLLLQLTNQWLNGMKTTDKITCVASLDIRKAFDSLDHELVIEKLKRFDLSAAMLSFLANYLSGRQQRTKANNHVSTTSIVTTGVPQGSVLGPFLFLTFVDDLLWRFEDTVLYADDCLVYASAATADCALEKLNELTEQILSWYTENRLSVNVEKTEVITICAKTNQIKEFKPLRVHGKNIKQTDKLKYLGVLVDQKLTWVPHFKKLKQKVYPAISQFSRIRKYMSKPLATLYYNSIVRSRLEYCSSVLMNGNKSNLSVVSKIENRCLRIICPKIDLPCSKRSIKQLRSDTAVVDIQARLRAKLVCLIHSFVHNFSLKIHQHFLSPTPYLRHVTRGGCTFQLSLNSNDHIRAPSHHCAVLWNNVSPDNTKKD